MTDPIRKNLIATLILVAVLTTFSIPAIAQTEKSNPATPNVSPPQAAVAPFDEKTAKRQQDAWARHLSVDMTMKNSIGMQLILIPPGRFRMGSPGDDKDHTPNEGPVDVELTKAFYLGKTEVTQAQWRAVMGTTPWDGKDMLEGDAYPVTFVNWDDAQSFCRKLSETEKQGYRLPTEAEWEYACRGGTTTRFSFGNDELLLGDYAWFGKTLGDGVDPKKYEREVGLKKANPFGLFDMHGNVGEWCEDWYDANYSNSPQVDPAGPSTGHNRVYRGGDWFADKVKWCRSANRGWGHPGAREFISLGFRVAAKPFGECAEN